MAIRARTLTVDVYVYHKSDNVSEILDRVGLYGSLYAARGGVILNTVIFICARAVAVYLHSLNTFATNPHIRLHVHYGRSSSCSSLICLVYLNTVMVISAQAVAVDVHIYHSLDTVAEIPDYIRLHGSSVSFLASSQVYLPHVRATALQDIVVVIWTQAVAVDVYIYVHYNLDKVAEIHDHDSHKMDSSL